MTKYVDGQACEIYGVNCNGSRHSRDLSCITVSSDPTGGVHTHNGTTSSGGAWYALVRYDDQQRIAWIGGKNSAGSFYEAYISYDPPAPGDLH